MTLSRKITFSALSSAIATLSILATRFLPLSFFPLMLSSVCYFIAFYCGIAFGTLSITTSFLLSFMWGSVDYLVLLLAGFFAVYSLAAFFLKNIKYSGPKQAAIRLGTVILLFNALFAALVFGFLDFAGEFIFGFNPAKILDSTLGYVIVAIVGSVLAAGYDIMFVLASDILLKRLKLDKAKKK